MKKNYDVRRGDPTDRSIKLLIVYNRKGLSDFAKDYGFKDAKAVIEKVFHGTMRMNTLITFSED